MTLVDAAQSAGHRPLDVREIGCDFLAFSGHKMCGPTGIGILYGKSRWLEKMPPYQGGGSMISLVTFEKTHYEVPPYRFEAGTPDIAGGIGLGAAIDYLEDIGRAATELLLQRLRGDVGLEPLRQHSLIDLAGGNLFLNAAHA